MSELKELMPPKHYLIAMPVIDEPKDVELSPQAKLLELERLGKV